MNSPQRDFGDFIRAQGLELDGDPEMDGQIHRVPVVGGKPTNKAGAYKGYMDGRPSGWVRNFRNGGEIEKWRAEQVMSPSAQVTPELRATLREKQAQRAAETLASETAVAGAAQALWAESPLATPKNAYLQRKGLSDQGLASGLRTVPDRVSAAATAKGIRIAQTVAESIAMREVEPGTHVFKAGDLLVPAADTDGNVWTLQSISPNFKSWMKGGRKLANFHLLGDPSDGQPILIAEGLATGASIAMAAEHSATVAVAFDAGNLDAVVAQLKARYPASPIAIMADDDRHRADGRNVGIDKARAAGEAHGVAVVPPAFLTNDNGDTDFNDLHLREGLDAVRQQVSQAIAQAAALSLPMPTKEITMTNNEESSAEMPSHDGIEHGPLPAAEPRPAADVGLVEALRAATRESRLVGPVPDPIAQDVLRARNLDALERELAASGVRGLKPLSGGASSVVLDAGENVVRIGYGEDIPRPDIPEVLQASQHGAVGGLRYEVLPKVDTASITPEDVATLTAQLAARGYQWGEAGSDNAGRHNGRLVVTDPGGVNPARASDAPPNLTNLEAAPDLLEQLRDAVNQRHVAPEVYRKIEPADAISQRADSYALWRSSATSQATATQLPPDLARHWAVADVLSLKEAQPQGRSAGLAKMAENMALDRDYSNSLSSLDPELHAALRRSSLKDQLSAAEADIRKSVSRETMKAERAALVQDSPQAIERLRALLPGGPIAQVSTEQLQDPAHGDLIAVRVRLESGSTHHVAFVDSEDQADVLSKRIADLAGKPRRSLSAEAEPSSDDGFSAGPDWHARPPTPDDGSAVSKVLESVTYEAQKDGSVLYMVNTKPAFIDHGQRILMNPRSSKEEDFILAAVLLAKEKYGGSFQLTGSEEFKRRAIEVIAKHDIGVQLKDPQQHAELQKKLGEQTPDTPVQPAASDKTPLDSAKDLLARVKSKVLERQDQADPDTSKLPEVMPQATPSALVPTKSKVQSDESLYEKAVDTVRTHQTASLALLQRELHIGYNRATRILEQMEAAGVVSTPAANGMRTLLAEPPHATAGAADGLKAADPVPPGDLTPEQASPERTRPIQAAAETLATVACAPANVPSADPNAPERSIFGMVVEHGPGPYEHKPGNEPSYFVKLQTANGVKEVWGADIPRALDESKVQIGEFVNLLSRGTEPVTVRVKDRDSSGTVIGEKDLATHRRSWELVQLEPILVAPTSDSRAKPGSTAALFAIPGESKMQGVLTINGKPQNVVAVMSPRAPDPQTGEIRPDYVKLFSQSPNGGLREIGHGNAVNQRLDGKQVFFDELLLRVGTQQISLRVAPSASPAQQQWLGFQEPAKPRPAQSLKTAVNVDPKPSAAVAVERPVPAVATNPRRASTARMRA